MLVEPVDSDDLAERAALWIADRIWSAIGSRGIAHLAVSGGSTPGVMFERLGTLHLPWDQVHIWQVDERVAPDGDPDRNALQLEPLRMASVHLAPVTAPDLAGAAARYGAELRASCRGVLDIVHLGIGDDGHTASWPPGVVVRSDVDVDVVGPFRGHARLTLTPPVVNAARERMLLAAGASKASVLTALIAGSSELPIGLVARTGLTILADRAALPGLTHTVSVE